MKKLRLLSIILCTLFILGVLWFTVTGSDNTSRYTARIVVSGSMEPTIPVYTVNIIKKCDISDVNNGDIILYNYKSDIIHRVININKAEDGIELIAQGDANKRPDDIVIDSNMFIGKVVKTLGWTRLIIKPICEGRSVSILLMSGICIIAIYIIYLIIKRYAKIYCIYRHIKANDNTGLNDGLNDIYANKKAIWIKAEKKYHEDRALKENSANNKADGQ